MQNYQLLLDLIHKFSTLKLWDYVDSRDVFQIKLSQKNVYLSILGNAQIEYGLVVYETIEDLSTQMLAENDSILVEQPDLPFHLSCLKIDCKDGKIMSQYDTSGRIFDYEIDDDCIAIRFNVGQPMRLVNEEECQLLIEVLTFIIEHYQSIIDLDFDGIDGKKTYSLSLHDNELGIEIIEFPSLIPPKFEVSHNIDESLIEELYNLEREDEWGIGIFYSPAFVEEETPYFPKICIVYNKTEDVILDLIIPYFDEYDEFPLFLLESLLKIGYLPAYLNIANFETLSYFAEVLDKLNIDGEVRMLEAFNDIYEGISKELNEEIEEEHKWVS